MPDVTYNFIQQSLTVRPDTTDMRPISQWPALDTSKPAFRHLDSSQWRRDGRSLVAMTSNVRPRNFGE